MGTAGLRRTAQLAHAIAAGVATFAVLLLAGCSAGTSSMKDAAGAPASAPPADDAPAARPSPDTPPTQPQQQPPGDVSSPAADPWAR